MAKSKPALGTIHFQQLCAEINALEIKCRANGLYATARILNDVVRKAGSKLIKKTPKAMPNIRATNPTAYFMIPPLLWLFYKGQSCNRAKDGWNGLNVQFVNIQEYAQNDPRTD